MVAALHSVMGRTGVCPALQVHAPTLSATPSQLPLGSSLHDVWMQAPPASSTGIAMSASTERSRLLRTMLEKLSARDRGAQHE